MTVTAPARPPVTTRRVGYLIAAAINTALMYAINVWPGWQTVPFLTDDTHRVLGLVTLSLAVGAIVNVIFLVADPPWVKALGNLVTAGIGLAVLAGVLQVFPFDFTNASFDWGLLIRVVMGVGIAGAALGVLVGIVSLVRRLLDGPAHTERG
jgi:hypothetical protein